MNSRALESINKLMAAPGAKEQQSLLADLFLEDDLRFVGLRDIQHEISSTYRKIVMTIEIYT